MQTTRRCGWIKFNKTQGLGDLREKGREERDTEREKIVWERESRALRVTGERRTCSREWVGGGGGGGGGGGERTGAGLCMTSRVRVSSAHIRALGIKILYFLKIT